MPVNRHQTPVFTPSQQLAQENRTMPSSSSQQQLRGPGARGLGAGVGSTNSRKSLGMSLNYRVPTSGGKTRLPQRDGGATTTGLGKGIAMRRRHRKVSLL